MVRGQQRPDVERAHERLLGSGQVERVTHPHPVEGTVGCAGRDVEVIATIDVQQTDPPELAPVKRGDDAQRHRAVAAQHQDVVPASHKRLDQAGEIDQVGHDLIDVLRERVHAIRPPDLHGQVAGVVHLSASPEHLDQAGGPQCCWRQLLPRRIAAGTARAAHDRQPSHLSDPRRRRLTPEGSAASAGVGRVGGARRRRRTQRGDLGVGHGPGEDPGRDQAQQRHRRHRRTDRRDVTVESQGTARNPGRDAVLGDRERRQDDHRHSRHREFAAPRRPTRRPSRPSGRWPSPRRRWRRRRARRLRSSAPSARRHARRPDRATRPGSARSARPTTAGRPGRRRPSPPMRCCRPRHR